MGVGGWEAELVYQFRFSASGLRVWPVDLLDDCRHPVVDRRGKVDLWTCAIRTAMWLSTTTVAVRSQSTDRSRSREELSRLNFTTPPCAWVTTRPCARRCSAPPASATVRAAPLGSSTTKPAKRSMPWANKRAQRARPTRVTGASLSLRARASLARR